LTCGFASRISPKNPNNFNVSDGLVAACRNRSALLQTLLAVVERGVFSRNARARISVDMELAGSADSSVTERRRARAAALRGGGPKAQRSRITNGKQLLMHGHGTAWARRCRDLIALHRSDIPEPSAAVDSLIRRIAMHEVQLEQLEQRFANTHEAGVIKASEKHALTAAANASRRHWRLAMNA
jgi:hypothetical protein